MLDVLFELERKALPDLLRNAQWQSLYIDYHPPTVERVWCQWGDYRVYLHRIHTCKAGKALFHPHPWPSAMEIYDGIYEMAVGFGSGDTPPPVAALIHLPPGSCYEMTHPDAWHSVRPLNRPAISLMVTGKPWQRSAPHSDKVLLALNKLEEQRLKSFFRRLYCLEEEK